MESKEGRELMKATRTEILYNRALDQDKTKSRMRDQRKVVDDLITKTIGQQAANHKWQSSLANEWRQHSQQLEDEKHLCYAVYGGWQLHGDEGARAHLSDDKIMLRGQTWALGDRCVYQHDLGLNVPPLSILSINQHHKTKAQHCPRSHLP